MHYNLTCASKFGSITEKIREDLSDAFFVCVEDSGALRAHAITDVEAVVL